jgi:hypothetical protein
VVVVVVVLVAAVVVIVVVVVIGKYLLCRYYFCVKFVAYKPKQWLSRRFCVFLLFTTFRTPF